jgi:hypothetical protein
MEFTYKSYMDLLQLLRNKEYVFNFYHEDVNKSEKSVILRHDVDFSIENAYQMAKYENELGVKSTYFVLLSTNFYNIFSRESTKMLEDIMELGHEIGLHFDEKRYECKSIDEMVRYAENESFILGNLLKRKVKVISMHRPSLLVLENDIKFDNLINSYSTIYFKDMKYISDSRMNWREDAFATIDSDNYNRLHILTHPFWYSSNVESMDYKLKEFINNAKSERYNILNDNFRNLEEVIKLEDIS